MLTRLDVILAKIESTYGVDSLPTPSADAILVQEPGWSHEGARMHERPAARSSAGMLPKIYGGTLKAVNFSMMLRGAGAPYSASVLPECDPLLRACGMGATLVTTPGSESVTYKPVSSGYESDSIYYYQDGTLHVLLGCRGNAAFSMEAGGPIKADFTFTGHESSPTDVALPSATYDTPVPPVFMNMGFAVGGDSAVISALNFDLSNTVPTPPSANAPDGYADIQITGRAPNGSFDPEHTLVATKNWIDEWKSAATRGLVTGQAGSTQYERISFSNPAIQYTEVSPGDRDGIRTLEIPFGMHESATDDEISIVFD